MDSKPFIWSSNIWGIMVLSFWGLKIVLFYEIIGEAFNGPPHQLMYIFDPAGNRVKTGALCWEADGNCMKFMNLFLIFKSL